MKCPNCGAIIKERPKKSLKLTKRDKKNQLSFEFHK
jgi:hypothetical protein